MPRYYFNVFDGDDSMDLEGTVLSDAQAAGVEALRFAGEIFRADAKKLLRGHPWHMEVTDNRSLLIFRIDFGITTFPLAYPS